MGFFLYGNMKAASGAFTAPTESEGKLPPSYPQIDPEIVAEVVGKSHFDLQRVKELVDPRPELARSSWDWRYGDVESAIGAASHVGRRDIALYLLEKGARPDIFCFAMLGKYEIVKSCVENIPGIQKTMGPHGFSLLHHAYAGERMKSDMTAAEQGQLAMTIDFLESLGDADGDTYLKMDEEEQSRYLGDYSYNSNELILSVGQNMRKMLALGPKGDFGGALFKTADHEFIYNGTPSVRVKFKEVNGVVTSLTIEEPGFTLTAFKIS